jgi:serine/threonine-protein kinase RsbT
VSTDTAITVAITHEADIVVARLKGRELAVQAGFAASELTLIATAISELARNIVVYAREGEIQLELHDRNGRRGLEVVARDRGPGIPDVSRAMRDGYSTSKSLGLGLPGARRLMDEFQIESVVGQGTTITMRKWVRERLA